MGEKINWVTASGSTCPFQRYIGVSRNDRIFSVKPKAFANQDACSAYTVKKYRSGTIRGNDDWQHRRISLHPAWMTPTYSNDELTEDRATEICVVAALISVLGLCKNIGYKSAITSDYG